MPTSTLSRPYFSSSRWHSTDAVQHIPFSPASRNTMEVPTWSKPGASSRSIFEVETVRLSEGKRERDREREGEREERDGEGGEEDPRH